MCIYKFLFSIRIMCRRYIIFVREEIDKRNDEIVYVLYVHRIFRRGMLVKSYKNALILLLTLVDTGSLKTSYERRIHFVLHALLSFLFVLGRRRNCERNAVEIHQRLLHACRKFLYGIQTIRPTDPQFEG